MQEKQKIKYVCGFLFDEANTLVALILKNKPIWQAGLLNGIGGKIEDNETPYQAMIREFQEETNVKVEDWELFCTLSGENDLLWSVYYYVAYSNIAISHITAQERSPTDEIVKVIELNSITQQKTINNLKWLIAMALSMDGDRANYFQIMEQ